MEMAIAGTCVGSLLPRISWCSPSGAKGQVDELGSLRLAFGGSSAAQRGSNNSRNVGICRAAQSSSSSQRHAIITGGNTGIGKATAIELARLGMSVTIGEHLGHFLLTALLLDKLKSSASPGTKSRVVVLASAAERIGNIDYADLNYKTRKYNEWQAYGQSRLVNCLFSHQLARRCKSLNVPITSNCVHPGAVDTDLFRYTFPQAMSKNWPSIPGFRPTLRRLLGLKTPEEGASTAVYLANAYEMEGKTGGYYGSSRMVSPSARANCPTRCGRSVKN